MKLIVIYTNNPLSAQAQIAKEFKIHPISKKIKGIKKINYFRVNSSLILICGKLTFNASEILNIFINLLIEQFGLFPFVFFDAINKITNGTSLILNRFSYPFENALMLQLQSSGLGEHEEYAAVVSKMVSNHINEIVDINPKILDCIVDGWTNKVDELLSLKETQLSIRINAFLDDLIKRQNIDSDKNINSIIMRFLKIIPETKWKESLEKFKIHKMLYNPDKETKFSDVILTSLVELIVKKEYSRTEENLGEGIESNAFKILEIEYLKLNTEKIRAEYKVPLFKLLPSVFVFLLSKGNSTNELIRSQAELIRLMKLIPYQKNEKVINLELNLVNYFKTGDILYGENRFIVCISPSCDVFRPKKVGFNLKFMIGEKVQKDLIGKLKDSEHLSILPDPDSENELITVKWNCSSTIVFEIKGNIANITQLQKYIRPYRFDSTYCQQILNKYIAYHSRVGVDELFIKDNSSSRNLFVFDKVIVAVPLQD